MYRYKMTVEPTEYMELELIPHVFYIISPIKIDLKEIFNNLKKPFTVYEFTEFDDARNGGKDAWLVKAMPGNKEWQDSVRFAVVG